MRTLWNSFEQCDNAFKRAKGLMFRGSFEKPLLFDFIFNHNAIHSFFCPRFDAIFLDDEKRVTEIFHDVAPNSFLTPARPSAFLIETPAGDARRKRLRVGSVLKWTPGGSIRLLQTNTRSKHQRSRTPNAR